MRKTFSFIFAVVMMMTAVLVSCDKNDPDFKNAVQMQTYGGTYYGDNYGNQTENFLLSFVTGDVTIDEEGNTKGNGDIVTIDFTSATAVDLFPAEGEYSVDTTANAGTVMPGFMYDFGPAFGLEEGVLLFPMGTYVDVVVADTLQATKMVVGGKLNVKGTKDAAEIQFKAVFEDGTEKAYEFKGAITIEDGSMTEGGEGGTEDLNFDFEPSAAETFNVNFPTAELANLGDAGTNNDVVELYLEKGEEWFGDIYLMVPTGSTTAKGTFTVADTYADFTCVASPGGDAEYDYPSFFGTDISADGYGVAYYIAGGQITVTDNGIRGELKTKKGSTINVKYDGPTALTDPTTQVKANAPERAMHKLSFNKNNITKDLLKSKLAK